jgi:hypothetical protein
LVNPVFIKGQVKGSIIFEVFAYPGAPCTAEFNPLVRQASNIAIRLSYVVWECTWYIGLEQKI